MKYKRKVNFFLQYKWRERIIAPSLQAIIHFIAILLYNWYKKKCYPACCSPIKNHVVAMLHELALYDMSGFMVTQPRSWELIESINFPLYTNFISFSSKNKRQNREKCDVLPLRWWNRCWFWLCGDGAAGAPERCCPVRLWAFRCLLVPNDEGRITSFSEFMSTAMFEI